MKKNKLTLILIVVLLVLFLPLSISSFILHKKYTTPVVINPKREFKFENKLYFYRGNNLLGTYDCENFNDFCDYASTKEEEKKYILKEPESLGGRLSLINNRFAFLIDSPTSKLNEAPVLLYDLTRNNVIGSYKEIKNYGMGLDKDYYIIKNEKDLWGVMTFSDGIELALPFNYEFIGINNSLSENGLLNSNIFVAMKDNEWQLFDSKGQELSPVFKSEIYNYDNHYIILDDIDGMKFMNYQGEAVFNGRYQYLDFSEDNPNYLYVIDQANNFYIYNLRTRNAITDPHYVSSISDVRVVEENGRLRLYINDVLIENVVVNQDSIDDNDLDVDIG
ncbi:MAG: hypothetical protein HFJ02_04220 [Bacilli bacterium]|nr:hypothetical protein [Bacilli bacterium]